jgi:hypothetical protein
MAKNSLPSIDDIDEDVLNTALLQGAKNMPSLSVKKQVEPIVIQKPAPQQKIVVQEDPASQRVTKAVSLPQYVWDWIKEQHRENDEPQNVTLLRSMKAGGAPIREEDLVDARKSRWAQKA